MAKAKKGKLTIEDALVPVEEQPYEIPENWCWTRANYVTSRISDGSHNPPKDSGNGIPLLSATNVHDGIIDYDNATRWITEDEYEQENERTQIEIGDVLLTIVATVGRTAVVESEDKFALQRSVSVLKPKIDGKYLKYYLDSSWVQQFMSDNAKGTAQKGFYLRQVEELCVALPPFAEQKRIVEQIENMFAKLESAKELLIDEIECNQKVIESIYQRAFEGKLTVEWRNENDIANWDKLLLKDCLELITYGFTNPMPDSDEGPWKVTAKNVKYGYIDYSDCRHTTVEAFKNELTDKSRPIKGDVLLTKDGSIGRTAVVDDERICISQSVALLRPNDRILPQYLKELLLTPNAQRIMELQASGTALKHIYITKIDKLEILLPSIDEQKLILEILDRNVDKCRNIIQITEKTISSIDLLKKTILAKAFRGELGTNNPEDESAVELLEKILE